MSDSWQMESALWRRRARTVVRTLVEHTPLAGRLFWRLPGGAPQVALTFDDGPDPEITPRVLDVLAAAGARATFFVVGQRAERQTKLVGRMLAEGHRVGNHTWSHARRPADLSLEVERARELLEALGGSATLFRPPFGAVPLLQVRRLFAQGYRVALWSRDSRDYRLVPASSIAALGSGLRPRDIMLLHDRFPNTLAALPELLARIADQGMELTTLDSGTGERDAAPARFTMPRRIGGIR